MRRMHEDRTAHPHPAFLVAIPFARKLGSSARKLVAVAQNLDSLDVLPHLERPLIIHQLKCDCARDKMAKHARQR